MTDIVDRIADCLLEDHVALMNENRALREALEATIIPLIRLGDFIGNEDEGGASGLGPFNRCEILLRVRKALEL